MGGEVGLEAGQGLGLILKARNNVLQTKHSQHVQYPVARDSNLRSPPWRLREFGNHFFFATVGTGISSAEDLLHCASVVLKAGCSVGISDSPILQAIHKVVGDAGSTELLCRLPHPSAADATVGAAWSVILLDHRKRQVLRDGVLQSLFHPGSEQRLCQGAAYPGRKRSKERYPVGANPHYS